jgi:hypothetical protein
VAACQSVIDGLSATCTSEPDRACAWAAFRDVCTTGRADALRTTADCFTGDDICRSFSDPGTTEHIECTNNARAAAATTESAASVDAYCAICDTDSLCAGDGAFGAPFEFLSVEDNTTITACLMAASTCDDALPCLSAVLPALAACFGG